MAKGKLVEKHISRVFPELSFTDIKLQRGANAEVFVMNSSDGNKLVLKVIDKTKKKERDLEGTEEVALKRVKSKFVVPLLDLKENERYKFFLFPFIEGKDLDEWLNERKQKNQAFSNEEILVFAKQMALAVIDMHKAGVIHQDIKPRNIRVTPEGNFVLVDLGIARFKEQGKRSLGRGAYGYSSPEQIFGAIPIPGSPPVTSSADHWAIGTIMYQMATLKHPFNMDADLTVNASAKNPQRENPKLDENLSKIITTLLNKHASGRYPVPEILLEVLNGREYQAPKAFDRTAVLFSLRRTPVGREFTKKYRTTVTDQNFIPHGVLLPAASINKNNQLLSLLKGQGYHVIIDPETYTLGITGGRSATQRFFHQEHKSKLISDTIGLQTKLGANYLISPYFCVEDIGGNELTLTTALYKESKEFLEIEDINLPLFGGLFLGRSILANEESRNRALDEIMDATDGLAGVYLLVDTSTGSMPISDRDLLIGLRLFVETLTKKIPVVLGYGDIIALGLIPSGLSGIVSHPYPSARKISIPQLRNLRKGKRGGRSSSPEQFYVPELLNFIRVTGELDQLITQDKYDYIGKVISCDCPFCRKEGIFQKAKIAPDVLRTLWKKEDRYNHFIYNFTADVNKMAGLSSVESRKYFLKKINEANDLYGEIKKRGAPLHPHSSGDFLKSWKDSFG